MIEPARLLSLAEEMAARAGEDESYSALAVLASHGALEALVNRLGGEMIASFNLKGSETPITPVTCGFARAGRRPETGQSNPLEGPRGAPAPEPNVDEAESDALRSSPGGSACPRPQARQPKAGCSRPWRPEKVLARLRAALRSRRSSS
jgi:hypothetical protein